MKVEYYKNGSMKFFEGTLDEWRNMVQVHYVDNGAVSSLSDVDEKKVEHSYGIPIFISEELRRKLPDWENIYLTRDFDGWYLWSVKPDFDGCEWLEPLATPLPSTAYGPFYEFIDDVEGFLVAAAVPDDLPDEQSIFRIVHA